MADPNVDISGMPDPPAGYQEKQSDPSVGMPSPVDLYTAHYGSAPASQDLLDEFTANPPQEKPMPSWKERASMLTGLPGAINKTVGGSVAGAVGFLGGAAPGVGAMIADPTNIGEHAAQAREGGRQGAAALTEGYNNLTDSLSPWQTKKGEKFGNELTSAPAQILGEASDSTLGRVLPDNAYQMVSDIGKDVGTVAPALGLPELGRGAVRGAKANVEAAKALVAKEKASISGEQPATTAAAAEAAKTTPDVGAPVTGEQLRNQPNPIPPPEGTVAAAREEARGVPKAAPEPPAEAPAVPAETQQAPAGTPSPGGAQRGSVRIFNAPKDEGPQETPAPETVPVRQQQLNDLDKLSGGALPTRRVSALIGDYNATGNDWQAAKTGNEAAQRQLATENDAMHAAVDNVHKSTGSLQPDSVDPTTLGNRGQIVRGAVQGIEDHFNKATDNIYDAARASSGTQPMPNFLNRASSFLADDANYMPEGFRRAAQARLQQLKTAGDAGIKGDGSDAAAPSSVGAAEKFREWLNANRTLDNMHTTRQLVNHTDMDVAENGGPGLFRAARAQRTHQAQMLEEPAGIKKLLAPGDSQGINHAIPEHKVMDYVNGLDREQHEHVMNVLRAGAHLSPELAESSAAAIREIQAHTVSRLHDAATNEGGKWNARDFYNATTQYARNAASTFKDRPDIVRNLKTINDAGNTLHMDKSYPGAVAQAARSGILTGAVKGAGAVASSLAHEIPVVGRIVGRGIEGATEAATGDIGKRAAEKAFEKRTVDRNGKQRGSVQVMRGDEERNPRTEYNANRQLAGGRTLNPEQNDIIRRLGGGEPLGAKIPGQRGAVGDLKQRAQVQSKASPNGDGTIDHMYSFPGTSKMSPGRGGSIIAREYPERGVTQTMLAHVDDAHKGKGWGTQMLAKAADDAHARGQVLHSDQQVSEGQAGAYKNLAQLGYDVKMKDNDVRGGARHAVGDHVFEVRPNAKSAAAAKYEDALRNAPRNKDGNINGNVAHRAHMEASKMLSDDERTAIQDRVSQNKASVPSGQRGSVQLFNDNKLNRSADEARDRQRGVGIEPRNERNERVANQQMGGRRPLSVEQNDILNRLSGGPRNIPLSQRGAVGDLSNNPQTKTPEFKAWSKDAPLVTKEAAASREFKTGEPVVVEAFHGTKRPDRVGEVMKRSRATSGPMAFHTSSPELASNYANSKNDTSLANEDQNYENWFKYRPQGSRSDVPIDRMWHYLDADTRKNIYEKAPTLHQDDEGKVVSSPGNKSGNGSYDYNLKQARGNPLKALTEDWLNSGNLFNREEDFMHVLHEAGVPNGAVKFDSPHAENPAVYRNYIRMDKPLVTSDIPKEVTAALNNAARTDRSKAQSGGADMWDKNNRTLREWVDILNSKDGTHAWTSIPDKATAIFKKLGYDGIIDKSGKNGGDEHPVYVPFTETQVKSAIGNKGKFDPNKKNILAKNESTQSGALA